MSNILIVPPKTIDQRQKIRLHEQGVIVVEVADPSKVRLLQPEFELPANDLIISLLEGVCRDSLKFAQVEFCQNLLQRLQAKEVKK